MMATESAVTKELTRVPKSTELLRKLQLPVFILLHENLQLDRYFY